MNRRQFAGKVLGIGAVTVLEGAGGEAAPALREAAEPLPKIGIRAASLRMAGKIEAIRVAAGIGGIQGLELQITAGSPNLRDWDVVSRYRSEAARWGMRIPSLAGVWDRGVGISSPEAAGNLRLSIRAAEMMGSNVLLIAFFAKQAPDMEREDSYGRIVAMLRQVAPDAAAAGVTLGLENSLNPADNAKLVDLVGHPAVRVYYDPHNMATYGYGEQAIPGVRLLGRERICAVHVKNGSNLIEDPGPVDWVAAFQALREIGYDGWYVYETSHASVEDCVADTGKNNAFLRRHVRVPGASPLTGD